MNQKNSKDNRLKKLAQFSGLGLQMGVTIYLGNLFGKWLDNYFGSNSQIYENIATMLAIFFVMYLVILKVNKISKDE